MTILGQDEKPEETAGKLLRTKDLWLATAESCTGGLLGHLITNVSGSSSYFRGGIIAYSNAIKEHILHVSPTTLKRHGAVSMETASEMAEGVTDVLKSDIGISITGIAGPSGGSRIKPVGTVFIALCDGKDKDTVAYGFSLKGNREAIKRQSAVKALELLIQFLTEYNDHG